jgi:hypothetical protein
VVPLAFAIVSRMCLFALYGLLLWKLPILTQADRDRARRTLAALLDSGAGLLRRRATETPAR